jgi:hypothetical protein
MGENGDMGSFFGKSLKITVARNDARAGKRATMENLRTVIGRQAGSA